MAFVPVGAGAVWCGVGTLGSPTCPIRDFASSIQCEADPITGRRLPFGPTMYNKSTRRAITSPSTSKEENGNKKIPAQNERYLHHIPANAASKANFPPGDKKFPRKMSATCTIFRHLSVKEMALTILFLHAILMKP